MITEVSKEDLMQISKVSKRLCSGDRKLNGYSKHVLKTIEKRLQQICK
jgi:hypothetical protein